MEKKNWTVNVYLKEKVVATWEIEDRTENEAFNEAEPDVSAYECDDWTMGVKEECTL